MAHVKLTPEMMFVSLTLEAEQTARILHRHWHMWVCPSNGAKLQASCLHTVINWTQATGFIHGTIRPISLVEVSTYFLF
jgi:hypothetical protein